MSGRLLSGWVEELIAELRIGMKMGCKMNISELLSSTILPISHRGVLRVLRRLAGSHGEQGEEEVEELQSL